MATRSAHPLDALLAAIPSIPRPVLSRLTARLLDRVDAMDGDTEEDLAAFRPVIGGRR